MSNEIMKMPPDVPANIQRAIGKIEDPDAAGEIAEYIAHIKTQNIAALGTDEVFKIADKQGEIRAFKSAITLSAKDGTLVQPVPNGPYVISAMGYKRLEVEVGAVVVNAPTVLFDGKLEQNPYVRRDPTNGRILSIYARAIAFRYTSKGIPQVSDRTTIFDIPSYRMIDLLAKAKKFKQAFKLMPADQAPEKKNGETWARYPFDESTVLWVNTAHEEAIALYSQIMNREKKAIDFAQTFAQRNAMKHLVGLQAVPGQTKPGSWDVTPIPQWTIPVVCWRPINGSVIKWDEAKYINVRNAVASLAEGKPSGDKVTAVELNAGTDYVEAVDVETEGDAEAEAEQVDQGEQTGPAEQAEAPELESKIENQYAAMLKVVPKEVLARAAKELKLTVKTGVRLTAKDMTAVLDRCNQIVDMEEAAQ